jgi:hypothetical protein
MDNAVPDRKVDIKDNHLGIKLIPMISTWDQVDPIFPVRSCNGRQAVMSALEALVLAGKGLHPFSVLLL